MGPYADLTEGVKVYTTGRILEVPVGPGLLGRVVNTLGAPIDGKGALDNDGVFSGYLHPALSEIQLKRISFLRIQREKGVRFFVPAR